MWLHIPVSVSAPDPACSTTELTLQSAERFAKSCTWRGKHSPSRIWRGRWSKVSWLQRLSGLTLGPSQAQTAALTWARYSVAAHSTSSSVASHASHGAKQAVAVARQMDAIYGPLHLKRLARTRPVSCSSRTSPASSRSLWEQSESSATWKALATKLFRESSQAKKLGRAKNGDASSFSLWSTPDAQVYNDTGDPQAHKARQIEQRKQHGSTPGTPLAMQIKTWPCDLWPAPVVADSDGGRTSKGKARPNEGGLSNAAKRWPTLAASDSRDGRNATRNRSPESTGNTGETMGDAIWLWPAITATDSEKRGKLNQATRQNGLAAAAQAFPTTPPSATTSRLGRLLQRWRPPECPRLNPRFAEWLMGWPVGLTNCALSATAWTRWQRATRSRLYGLVCNGD